MEKNGKKELTEPDPVDKLGDYIRDLSKELEHGRLEITIFCEVHYEQTKMIEIKTTESVKKFR